MTLVLRSHEVDLLSRLTETLVAPLAPTPEDWWRDVSRGLLELFGGDHVMCALPGHRMSRELDDSVVRDIAALSAVFNPRGAEARRADPIYFRLNTPRVEQLCAIWNRVGTLRRTVAGRRCTSRAFEIFQAARMTESANVDLSGPFGQAGLCVSFERTTDPERTHALTSIVAAAFRAGARTLACERKLVTDPRLTPRERQIAALLVARRMNHEIARTLGISEHTVRHHVEAVCAKLGVRSRHDVAACLR